jgi:hypothetical protein
MKSGKRQDHYCCKGGFFTSLYRTLYKISNLDINSLVL